MTIQDELEYLIKQIDKCVNDNNYRAIKYLNEGLKYVTSILNKGWSMDTDFTDFDDLNDIPDLNKEDIESTIQDLIKAAKFEARLEVFLIDSDEHPIMKQWCEIENFINGVEYDTEKVKIKSVFEFWELEDIYNSIKNE